MTASAHDIAAALRARQPGLGKVKLQKLLYYCQGHHLAHFGEPLFAEPISAWDMGPVVPAVWSYENQNEPRGASGQVLDEGQLNTIGYVLSRYGAMTGNDLALLSHAEAPWRDADRRRAPGGSAPIPNEAIREYFAGDGAPEVAEGVEFDRAEVAALVAGAWERRQEPSRPDDLEGIRARLARAGA